MPSIEMEYYFDLESFLNAVKENRCKANMMVKLNNKRLRDKDAAAIANALTTHHCLPGLYFNLQNNRIGDEGAIAIANALKTGLCPKKLQFDFTGNDIKFKGVAAFADAISSGYCPSKLVLCLSGERGNQHDLSCFSRAGRNKIDDKCVEVIATALKAQNCPSELTLDLRESDMSNYGLMAIYNALRVYCPPQFTLLLSSRTHNLDTELYNSVNAILHKNNGQVIHVTP
jgi:hypothetical protein